ncbi:MAG: diaminopimelate epimerase [Candidatus Sericytochromatia bacterium]|nr:diaminopimelate epimerase [Candidatus Sericytochromatia bacterium]
MTATIPFWKMHGTGNDFVVFDGAALPAGTVLADLGKRLCDRHFGIGADGLLIRWPSERGHAWMQIINSDGSEAGMCGNGIRCMAMYLNANGTTEDALQIETLGGMIRPTVVDAEQVRVAMGQPRLQAAEIPIVGFGDGRVVDAPISANGHDYRFTTVSMGNPHVVIFVNDLAGVPVPEDGAALEMSASFPDRANIEFVEVISRQSVRMRGWERGAGLTMACGTGACAVVVAGVLTGRLDRDVAVTLPGGVLQICWPADDAEVIMTGPAAMVFEGQFSV